VEDVKQATLRCGTCWLSVVTPAYNEAAGIEEGLQSFAQVLENLTDAWEIVVVDDGSEDDTFEIVENLARMEPRIKGVRLSRNFGKESALLAGLSYARGEAVVTIDSDLQHPPELIPEMVNKWKAGARVVHAVKRTRQSDALMPKARAKIFNAIMSLMSGIDMSGASDYKLMDRFVVDTLVREMPERRRFFRGLASWVGFSQTTVPFDVGVRSQGVTTWSVLGLLGLAATAIESFTSAPLRIVTILGLVTFIFGAIVATDAMWSYFHGESVSGFATIIITLLIIGSFIMLSLGIIGEYIAKIYEEVKARPSFLVDREIGFK
jgi:glycosyltransferase involved in cell wall biosynthesis